MLKTLKNALTGKGNNEAAILNTANIIRSRSGEPEVKTLEDAVAAVILHATAMTKSAVSREDQAASSAPADAEYLMPTVLLCMVLTQKLWIILDEKFDGGRVASYVALTHSLQYPNKDTMELFNEGATKYNAVHEALSADSDDFREKLSLLIKNPDPDAVTAAFKPVYETIRDCHKSVPFP